MKHSSELFIDAPNELVVEVLSDLSTYPSWNDLVSSSEPLEQTNDDPGPVWSTTLTAKVGPFARSKQLRFVRDTLTTSTEQSIVGFCRREVDGRSHAAWKMTSVVSPGAASANASIVELTLSYDGGLWIPALGSVLDGSIERATRRLPNYVEERS